jgi:hypothetical protein
MQILLQERSTTFRLHALKGILIEVVGELGAVLVEEGIITQAILDEIRVRGEQDDEDDSDLMPASDLAGITLQSELSEVLVQQLGLSPRDGLVAARADLDGLVSGFAGPPNDMVGGGSGEEETAAATATVGDADSVTDAITDKDDDIWNGRGAFQ